MVANLAMLDIQVNLVPKVPREKKGPMARRVKEDPEVLLARMVVTERRVAQEFLEPLDLLASPDPGDNQV